MASIIWFLALHLVELILQINITNPNILTFDIRMSFLDNGGTKSRMTERVPKTERCPAAHLFIQNNK
jgi:hypothetical protein